MTSVRTRRGRGLPLLPLYRGLPSIHLTPFWAIEANAACPPQRTRTAATGSLVGDWNAAIGRGIESRRSESPDGKSAIGRRWPERGCQGDGINPESNMPSTFERSSAVVMNHLVPFHGKHSFVHSGALEGAQVTHVQIQVLKPGGFRNEWRVDN
jgi:hypothetical protein